jgi:DNA-binding NtrC family response regulator
VRQLEHAIKVAMVRARDETVTPADLGEKEGGAAEEPVRFPTYHEAKARAQSDFKQKYLKDLMQEAGGVVNEAARIADLPPSSLRKMLREEGIDRNRS